MKSGILGVFDGSPSSDTVESVAQPDLVVGLKGTQETLNGGTIHEGIAAREQSTEQARVRIRGGEVVTERETVRDGAETAFLADLDAGYAIISRSDGEFLFNVLAAQTGEWIERAGVDVEAFAGYVESEGGNPQYWMSGKDHGESVRIAYHDVQASDVADSNIGLGFEYGWHAWWVRGVVYRSGYVNIFGPDFDSPTFARWLTEELLPFATVSEDSDDTDEAQQTLEDTGSSDTEHQPDRSVEDVAETIISGYDDQDVVSVDVVCSRMAEKYGVDEQDLHARVLEEVDDD